MPVKSVAYSELLSAEIATTAKKVSVIINKAPQEAVLLNQLNTDLKTKILALEERSGKRVQLELEETPSIADERRDSIYYQILQYIKGCRHSPRPDDSAAAEQIYDLLDQHDTKLTTLGYDIESHHINSLLLDLKKPQYLEPIKTLGLENLVSDLETAQRKFEDVNKQKLEQNASFDLPQVQTLVSPIRSVLNEILVLLGTMERFNPDTYTTIVNETNELLNEVGSKVKARRTRKNNAEQQKSAS